MDKVLANLRHLFENLVSGSVRDTASAKRIAEGVLAPAIELIEQSLTQDKSELAAIGAGGVERLRDMPIAPAEPSLRHALEIVEAALADIGDADREPGDDVAWCEARAAKALPIARKALTAQPEPTPKAPANDVINKIMRGCCESNVADPYHLDTINISTSDLRGILECWIEPTAKAATETNPEVHEPRCPALIGDRCTCEKHDPNIDKAGAQFCGGIGDEPCSPYPGMISAFERYYSQSFADKDWRNEASVWAAAWKAAKAPAAMEPPASQRDELLQVALDFIGTLTGMSPPPIEVAPPEVFAPFYDFVDRVQAITSIRAAQPKPMPVANVCRHRVADARNKVVKSGYLCINCGALFGAADQGAQFQDRVEPWMHACFGPEIAADRMERNHRFLEEALELVQSTGCTQSEAHQLVDYVFARPVGEPAQEAGGVMVTLAALCLASDLNMHEAGETELARIWTKVEAIRAKQAAKPKHSPLAEAVHRTAPMESSTKDALNKLQEMWDELASQQRGDGRAINPYCMRRWSDALSTIEQTMTAGALIPTAQTDPAAPADALDAPPSRTGIYAWVSGTTAALVLVDERPSAHAPGGQFNGHVIHSTRFYDGCAVTDWRRGKWTLLHDFNAAIAAQNGGAA